MDLKSEIKDTFLYKNQKQLFKNNFSKELLKKVQQKNQKIKKKHKNTKTFFYCL